MSLHPIPATLAVKRDLTKPVDEPHRPEFKFCTHLACALCGGIILLILFHFDFGGPGLDAFGPVIPSALQEILDLVKRL